MGRSARPARPWAEAAAGAATAAPSAPAVATARRRAVIGDPSRRDLQGADLHAGFLELDHEAPVDCGREAEGDLSVGGDVLVDVVAVDVDLLGRVRVDGEVDGVALVDVDVLDAPDGLLVLDVDRHGARGRRAVV